MLRVKINFFVQLVHSKGIRKEKKKQSCGRHLPAVLRKLSTAPSRITPYFCAEKGACGFFNVFWLRKFFTDLVLLSGTSKIPEVNTRHPAISRLLPQPPVPHRVLQIQLATALNILHKLPLIMLHMTDMSILNVLRLNMRYSPHVVIDVRVQVGVFQRWRLWRLLMVEKLVGRRWAPGLLILGLLVALVVFVLVNNTRAVVSRQLLGNRRHGRRRRQPVHGYSIMPTHTRVSLFLAALETMTHGRSTGTCVLRHELEEET